MARCEDVVAVVVVFAAVEVLGVFCGAGGGSDGVRFLFNSCDCAATPFVTLGVGAVATGGCAVCSTCTGAAIAASIFAVVMSAGK
jgi:hypothetical protein